MSTRQTKKTVNDRARFPSESETWREDALHYIHEALAMLSEKKRALKTELLAEETLVLFARHAAKGAALTVQIRRSGGDAAVILAMEGEAFDPYGGAAGITEDDASEDVIRGVLLRSQGEKFKYTHTGAVNQVRIQTGRSDRKVQSATFIALGLGLIFGLLGRFVLPAAFTSAVCDYLLTPARTMFMNALKIVIAPMVFFSIVTCVSQFGSLKELGKLGAKVIGMYLLTTVFAVGLGIGLFTLFQPGVFGFALSGGFETAAPAVDAAADTSLLNTIVNIVPSNFLAPFVEADTLQLIFLAVLCGAAVGMIGQYSGVIKNLFEACNSLFLTLMSLIARLIPLAVFASVALMTVQMGGNSFKSVLSVSGVFVLAIFCMLLIYAVLILALGRLNPLTFYRKNWEGMVTSFTLSSSSAAMPTNMRICTEKLGVSPRVSSFSIPLGATINMDGACIFLAILGLFLARAYGVAVPPSMILSLSITIVLLSLGAPGAPGAAFLCLAVVLRTLNVPVEAIGLIMAINPILDMFDTMSNTTGDMAAAVIVAHSENLLDTEVYNSR